MRTMYPILAIALSFAACHNGKDEADAHGNFEAVETLVSAKGSGELLRFNVEEGMHLDAGTEVGVIDTTLLHLQSVEVGANRKAMATRSGDVVAQVAVQDARLKDLQREEERLVKLVAGKAATTKQLDDIRGQIAIQRKQIAAVEAQNPNVTAQVRALAAKEDVLQQQLKDLRLVNPVNGTVVSKLAEVHELVMPGKALYRIARMDTLELRAYVSGADLSRIRAGAAVEVGVDRGDSGIVRLPGRVSWISNEAEFTPKTIQTREERVDMVYAFKVRVANDNGLLKNGMPGEVYFNAAAK